METAEQLSTDPYWTGGGSSPVSRTSGKKLLICVRFSALMSTVL